MDPTPTTQNNGKDTLPQMEPGDMRLVLTLSANGANLNVAGPIHNKLLCYGMLDLAKDVIKDFNDKHQGRIQVPVGPLPFLRDRP